MRQGDRFCVANRVGEGSALAEQIRSAEGGRRGLFEVPFRRSLGRNEFHSRTDERLSAVEPKRLSRAEAFSLFQGSEETLRIEVGKIGPETNPLQALNSRADGSLYLRRTSRPFLRRSCHHRLEWQ
jgi:hypothetical protein